MEKVKPEKGNIKQFFELWNFEKWSSKKGSKIFRSEISFTSAPLSLIRLLSQSFVQHELLQARQRYLAFPLSLRTIRTQDMALGSVNWSIHMGASCGHAGYGAAIHAPCSHTPVHVLTDRGDSLGHTLLSFECFTCSFLRITQRSELHDTMSDLIRPCAPVPAKLERPATPIPQSTVRNGVVVVLCCVARSLCTFQALMLSIFVESSAT